MFTSAIILIAFSALIASLVFFLKRVSYDLNESLYALFQIIGMSSVLYMFMVMLFLRHKMHTIFEILADIYEACKKCFIHQTRQFNSIY